MVDDATATDTTVVAVCANVEFQNRSQFAAIEPTNHAEHRVLSKQLPVRFPRAYRLLPVSTQFLPGHYFFTVFTFLETKVPVLLFCRVTSPLLLFAIAGSFYAGYRLQKRSEQQKLVLFGHELTLAQQYGVVALCSMPIYYIVGAGAAMFWVLGASFFVITLHAALYNIDALISEGDDSFGLTQEV